MSVSNARGFIQGGISCKGGGGGGNQDRSRQGLCVRGGGVELESDKLEVIVQLQRTSDPPGTLGFYVPFYNADADARLRPAPAQHHAEALGGEMAGWKEGRTDGGWAEEGGETKLSPLTLTQSKQWVGGGEVRGSGCFNTLMSPAYICVCARVCVEVQLSKEP